MRTHDEFKNEIFDKVEKHKKERTKKIKRAVYTTLPCLFLLVATVLIFTVLQNESKKANDMEIEVSEDMAPESIWESDKYTSIFGNSNVSAMAPRLRQVTISEYKNNKLKNETEYTDENDISEIEKSILNILPPSESSSGSEICDTTSDTSKVQYKITLSYDSSTESYIIYTDNTVSVNGAEAVKIDEITDIIKEYLKS